MICSLYFLYMTHLNGASLVKCLKWIIWIMPSKPWVKWMHGPTKEDIGWLQQHVCLGVCGRFVKWSWSSWKSPVPLFDACQPVGSTIRHWLVPPKLPLAFGSCNGPSINQRSVEKHETSVGILCELCWCCGLHGQAAHLVLLYSSPKFSRCDGESRVALHLPFRAEVLVFDLQ